MDERIKRICELVYLLNSKGKRLSVHMNYIQIDVIDCNDGCRRISKQAYLHDSVWENEANENINKMLEILEEMWREIK